MLNYKNQKVRNYHEIDKEIIGGKCDGYLQHQREINPNEIAPQISFLKEVICFICFPLCKIPVNYETHF